MEPHELVWKSVTAILHRIFVSIFKSVFQNLRFMAISRLYPNNCVFGPGDAWACPRIYRFILKTENVGQTISDSGQKFPGPGRLGSFGLGRKASGDTIGNTIGNTRGNTRGNTIGNKRGNTIGSTIGNTIGHNKNM